MRTSVLEKKIKIYKTLFSLFLTKPPSDELIGKYFNHYDEGGIYNDLGFMQMQEFILSHLKSEFRWSTGLGIIEGIEHIIEEAIINDNIDSNWDYEN